MQPTNWSAEQLGKVEDRIRQTYWQVAGARNRLVSLAELRAALPAELSREQVDAALTNLRDHSDVHLIPRTEQRHASPEMQAAALAGGGAHDHQLSIDYTQDAGRVAERLHSRDQGRATSMVAALSDSKVFDVAREMGVPVSADVQQVRADLVATSVANRDAWLADARQGANDGMMLYRADTEPQWAASLNSDERQELAAAAARLQQRAATEPSWAYVKDRADRWADPGASVDTSTPARENDGATRQRETDGPARESEGDPDKYHEVDDELARLAAGGMTAGDMERDDAEHLSPEEHRWFEAQEDAANRESLETPDRADAGERVETADPGPAASIGPELRAARSYLEQRPERDPAPREPAERATAAQQEQAHRESARVVSEQRQAEPQRGIER